MKTVNLGQTIGILANVGVIVGIVFLAIEINQNNQQLAAQSRFNYYQARAASNRSLAENGEIVAMIEKAVAGESLTSVEQTRLALLYSSIFTQWEYEFSELETGLISTDEYNIAAKRAVVSYLKSVVLPIWENYKSSAPERFVQHVEEEILLD